MKLEIARGLFLLSALAIASLALVAWEQPGTRILTTANGTGHCPLPRVAKVGGDVKPDHDLLLFMFGLSQGLKPQS
ncbi:hypothetical protein CCU68_15600 [Pseudomonas gingeri NCPPB 3146 = LMG 5327]|uniref:Uncharacterized protein n=2 Tax=Pseudomonas gingeri TaxID=117681 RepID=A0A7Y7Y4A4_9PSED|nr:MULTISPECIES: hypothetical protein [Pseudomonas]NVZ26126.1 hypothetical protein [Pseudomonas gingeri]NVZ61115.1 hypothetical protein [Pseudomonas gingeri]NVZ75320.1 hypothetical protein [Pseudomonas gingeri]NWA08133.1 hypothetical protein [Pseudomonas gingeri]NWC17376.1 hypothetical protein [Pseudomonas gingeri]